MAGLEIHNDTKIDNTHYKKSTKTQNKAAKVETLYAATYDARNMLLFFWYLKFRVGGDCYLKSFEFKPFREMMNADITVHCGSLSCSVYQLSNSPVKGHCTKFIFVTRKMPPLEITPIALKHVFRL